MMDASFLLLWFEAPLQSWGADSKFGRRDTLHFPTKSGVLGLVCAALGASGEQRELLEEMAGRRQTVISYTRTIKNKGTTTRAEQEILLRDFHMVGSGYDDSKSWLSMHIPKKADGGRAVGGGTKMTYRYYLQDAKFAVVMEVPSSRAEPFALALQNPVYDIYLGRKNCVPTDFVYRGIFDHETDAIAAADEIAVEKSLEENFRIVPGEADGESYTLNDVPVQFGPIKKYRDRIVTKISRAQNG
jgi:CRISPR system Cascade subunit CasD